MCRCFLFAAATGLISACAALPASADEPHGRPANGHLEVNAIVTRIVSGFLFVGPFEGLRSRPISPRKADRAGLHEAKLGDEVTVIVDEGNVLVDVHRTGTPPAGHRLVQGHLYYADTYWGEVKLSTPEGDERFEVDPLAGSKLAVFSEGSPVTVELDEDNMVIDIHRIR
jgi:hypothetical protein